MPTLMRPIVTLSVPKRQELKPDSAGDMRGVLKKKHSGGNHKLHQYSRYEDDSECAFFGFVPESDLCN